MLSRCKPITGLVEPKRQLWRRSGLRPFPQKPPCNFLELQGHPERIRKVNQLSSALNFTNMAFSSFVIWALAATVKEEWAASCAGKNHLAISSSYIVIQKIYNVIQNKITSIIDATLKRKILHPRYPEIKGVMFVEKRAPHILTHDWDSGTCRQGSTNWRCLCIVRLCTQDGPGPIMPWCILGAGWQAVTRLLV